MANEQQQLEREAQQPGLEDTVEKEHKETKEKGLLRKVGSYALNTAAAVGATALGVSIAGVSAPLLGLAYAGAHLGYDALFNRKNIKEKDDYEAKDPFLRYLKAYTTGAFAAGVFEYIFPFVSGMIPNETLVGKVARGAVGATAGAAAYATAYTPIDYVAQKGTVKGLGKHMVKKTGENIKGFMKYYGLPIALLENDIMLGFPGIIAGGALQGYMENKKNEKKKVKDTAQEKAPGYNPMPAGMPLPAGAR